MRAKSKKALRPAAKASAGVVPLPPARLSNEQDNVVLAELQNASLGSLELDRFADLLSLKRQSGDAAIVELRSAVAYVYVRAALARAVRKVTEAELTSVEAAIVLLQRAVKHLEVAIPEHERGFKGAFAIPADDPKGLEEATDFSSFCSSARFEIINATMTLDQVARAERTKPVLSGKPKERLRILTEGFAELWFAATDKAISPSVKSKPRDFAPSVVIGRSGAFLEFAKSVLFELDSFNPTEIESAVTNVAKRRSRRSAS